jgi:hypothetical protein
LLNPALDCFINKRFSAFITLAYVFNNVHFKQSDGTINTAPPNPIKQV